MDNSVREEFQSISLADLWNVVVRRKMIILFSAFFMVFVALIYLKVATKIYHAQSVILLDHQKRNLEIETVVNDNLVSPTYIPSEIQVLRSRELMEKVLEKVGVFDNPALLWSSQSVTGGTGQATNLSEERKNSLISAALGHLSVTQVEKSRAIEIGYDSPNRALSADLVNVLVDLYIRGQLSSSQSTISSTSDWLKRRVEQLQDEVKAIDTKLVEYRKKSGFISSGGIALIENEISQFSTKLIDAQAALTAAEARWNEINSAKSRETAPDVLRSPIIQRLTERQSLNKDKVAELSKAYGPEHPEMVSARNRLMEVTHKIDLEIRKIAESLKREYEIAKANTAEIELRLDSLKSQYNDLKAYNIKLLELEREEANSKNLLAKLDLRWKEIQVQEDQHLQEPYARVLSKANIPVYPKSPKPKLTLAAAIIAGIGIGLALAVAIDYMQTGVYNGIQLQKHTGLSNIALIPKLPGSKASQISQSMAQLSNSPLSDYTESLRSLTTYLKKNLERSPSDKVFNFTSVVRDSGKSPLVAAVARQMSLEGSRVLVIDCDLRNPSLGEAFGLKGERGLSDILGGSAQLEDVVLRGGDSALDVVGIGTATDVNLIKKGAALWKVLLAHACVQYDVILLDGPSALHISDMTILAEGSQNILCVCWQKTPMKHILYAKNVLEDLNFTLLGTVITLVNSRKIKRLNNVS